MFLMGKVRPDRWALSVVCAGLMAFGIALGFYGVAEGSPLWLRVFLIVVVSLAIVSTAFNAGRGYERLHPGE